VILLIEGVCGATSNPPYTPRMPASATAARVALVMVTTMLVGCATRDASTPAVAETVVPEEALGQGADLQEIVVGGDRVYWIESYARRALPSPLWSSPAAGGAARKIDDGGSYIHLVATPAYLYTLELLRQVRRIPVDGGTAEVVHEGEVCLLASDGDDVLVFEHHRIIRLGVTGTRDVHEVPEIELCAGTARVRDGVVYWLGDASREFWARTEPGAESLWRIPLGAGAKPAQVITAPIVGNGKVLTWDILGDTFVFATLADPAIPGVFHRRFGASASRQTFADAKVFRLAVDTDGAIYASAQLPGDRVHQLYRLDPGGGHERRALLDSPLPAAAIQLAGEHVYWHDTRQARRARKR
jgi:hypothetical protein